MASPDRQSNNYDSSDQIKRNQAALLLEGLELGYIVSIKAAQEDLSHTPQTPAFASERAKYLAQIYYYRQELTKSEDTSIPSFYAQNHGFYQETIRR